MESSDAVVDEAKTTSTANLEMKGRDNRRSQNHRTDGLASSNEESKTDTEMEDLTTADKSSARSKWRPEKTNGTCIETGTTLNSMPHQIEESINDDEESDQNGDQLPANDDDGKQPSTVLSEPNVIKSKRMVSDDNGFVTDKCRPTTKGNRRTNIASEVCETGDKAAFTKRRSQSPNMLFDHESDGSGDVEDMDLEDLVVRDECSSVEGEEELLRQRRCMSDSEILRHTTASRPVERAHSASPYKYRRPDPIICDESIEIDCLMRRAHFFLARSCRENIRLAKERSFWTTSPRIEQTLGESFMKASAVILVFIEKGADHFAGFAKMCSKALYRGQPALCWKEFNGGGNIKLQWISRCTLPITATKHLKNSLNHGKAVYAGVDGSKIQRTTGRQLCSLFPIDESIDLSTLRVTRGKKRVHRRGYSSKRRRKSELPSLLDRPISFTQFKRAKRNLTAEERWENDALNFMYSSSFSYKGHSTHKMSFEDALQYELYRPMPLMDLAVDYPLSTSSSSRRKSHSRSERDREWRDRDRDRMHRISPSRRHSPVLNAHLHRDSNSKMSSHDRKSSHERKHTERKRHAERTPPRRRESPRRINAVEKHHKSSSSRSYLREREREGHRESRHEIGEKKTKRRRRS